METHKHTWQVTSYHGGHLTLQCYCGEKSERNATPEELALWKRIWEVTSEDRHATLDKWRKYTRKGNPKGYELIELAEKFHEEHPGETELCFIDDTHFASSIILLIHHGTGDNYMGATWVVIPQLDGQEPCEFFTCPGHARSIAEAAGVVAERGKGATLERQQKAPSAFDAFAPERLASKPWYQGKLDEPNHPRENTSENS